MMKDLLREPSHDESAVDYIIPRTVVLFLGLLLFIAVCCVIGTYID